MTGKDVLLEGELLGKAATIKRFEYSPLASQLKTQIDIAKKPISKIGQGVWISWNSKKKKKSDRKPTLKKYNKSDVRYNANHSFYKYRDSKKFDILSLESKYSFLVSVFNDLDKFSKLKPQKKNQKRKKQMFVIQPQNYVMTC